MKKILSLVAISIFALTACGQASDSEVKGIGTNLSLAERKIYPMIDGYQMEGNLRGMIKGLSGDKVTLNVYPTLDMNMNITIKLTTVKIPSFETQVVTLPESTLTGSFDKIQKDFQSKYITVVDGTITEFCSGSLTANCDINFVNGQYVLTVDGKAIVVPNK